MSKIEVIRALLIHQKMGSEVLLSYWRLIKSTEVFDNIGEENRENHENYIIEGLMDNHKGDLYCINKKEIKL